MKTRKYHFKQNYLWGDPVPSLQKDPGAWMIDNSNDLSDWQLTWGFLILRPEEEEKWLANTAL